ncbi:MAG: protein translocase subunit SecF [Bacteroidetes bacterium]|nr:protein translocase subunit SecF [Bacteroidota bacterium]
MHFFKKTNIDFIGKRRVWYIVSTVITLAGIVWALFKGVEYGIDFAGGTEIQLKFAKQIRIDEIRSALDAGGFRGAEVKYYGADESGILVRVREGAAGAEAGAKTSSDVQEALTKAFPNNAFDHSKTQTTHIGAKIGAELKQKALFAVLFTCIAILIYLAFRFEFVYGLGAVIAIIHDVLVAFAFAVVCNGFAPWLNLEMNSTMLAAFLTIVGFSVNDTVIIFDRIREDKKKYKGQDLKTIMNRAINETLPRTIITSGTVFLTLVVLFIWGGEVLRGFAFTMLIGVITGTYSSIFVASAIAYDWIHRNRELKAEGASVRTAQKQVATTVS